MNVSHVRIRNVMGVKALDIEPGKVTVVEGDNGSGKTSVLEAIRAVIRGGHDATLLRNGATEGEVVIVLEDGTELWRQITPTKSVLKITDSNGKPVRAPAGWIKGLTDTVAINPVSFLTCTNKDRARIIAEAMPVPLTDEMADQISVHLEDADVEDLRLDRDSALESINAANKEIYDARTGFNRLAKKAKADVERLSETVPFGFDATEDHSEELKQSRDTLYALNLQASRDQARIAQRVQADTSAAWTKFEKQRAALLRETDAKIAEMRAAVHDFAGSVQAEADVEVEGLGGEIGPRQEELKRDVTLLEERARTSDYHARSLKMLEHEKEEAHFQVTNAENCTSAIQALNLMKNQILNSLPIFGLSVEEGQVMYFGVPFERTNTAVQVQVAVEVAKLRAGGIPLVCLDGMECLASDTFEMFVDALAESNLQAIVTRVTSERGLQVHTIAEEL